MFGFVSESESMENAKTAENNTKLFLNFVFSSVCCLLEASSVVLCVYFLIGLIKF